MSIHRRVRKIHRRNQRIPDALQNASLHPVLKRIYANRQVSSLAQIDYTLDRLINYKELKGIDTAANILADAILRRDILLAAREVNADEAIRVVVLTGDGKGFDAGTDLPDLPHDRRRS